MNDRLFIILYTFSKILQAQDFVASKHYGSQEKINQKFIVDECARHVTLLSIFFYTGVIVRARWQASLAVLAIN